jgi:hypothetical protein
MRGTRFKQEQIIWAFETHIGAKAFFISFDKYGIFVKSFDAAEFNLYLFGGKLLHGRGHLAGNIRADFL